MRYEVEVRYESKYVYAEEADSPTGALEQAQKRGLGDRHPEWTTLTFEVHKGVDGKSATD